MKIVAINGSPKGSSGNTHILVESFLRGAQTAGAEILNILLAAKDIRHCKGCHTCWFSTPGRCVIQDDMTSVLAEAAGADIIVLATPVYFENISGMLKVFMDRLTMTGNPHATRAADSHAAPVTPKLMIISSCGFPGKDQFAVISHWTNRVALKMGTELIGEIYAPQGKLFRSTPPELQQPISNYLKCVEQAGHEVATRMKLSMETVNSLARSPLF